MISTPRMIRLALTLLIGASFAACSGDDPGTGSGNGTTPPPPPPTATNAVNVVDNDFNPTSVTVSVGTTVTWTWFGVNPHTVTFDDGVGNSFQQTGGTHTRQFSAAGTFPYHCTIHGTPMSGTVVVQ